MPGDERVVKRLFVAFKQGCDPTHDILILHGTLLAALCSFEFDLAEPKHSRDKPPTIVRLFLCHADCLHPLECLQELLRVIHAFDFEAATLGEILVLVSRHDMKISLLLLSQSCAELVENVEVPLIHCRLYYARFLEEVVRHRGPSGVVSEIEEDLHVLSEAGRVIVSYRFRVTERLQKRVRGKDFVFHALDALAGARGCGDVLHDLFAGLCLAGSTLPTDDDALIDAIHLELPVCVL
mmetsp:Transcript_28371/g.69117  ORF Transcript_28371/g.69117 Transcript_28371/m.69117 type:complete len:238 (-) Transcript_28371:474-1187(-)